MAYYVIVDGETVIITEDHGEANDAAERTALAHTSKAVVVAQTIATYASEIRVVMKKAGEA